MEGHPDNVAACLAGGLTIAWTEDELPRMVRLEPLSGIRPVVCIAPAALHTEVARGLLPDLSRTARPPLTPGAAHCWSPR